jgi:hypothetical protein
MENRAVGRVGDVYIQASATVANLVGFLAIGFRADGDRSLGCAVSGQDYVVASGFGFGSATCDDAVTILVQIAVDE